MEQLPRRHHVSVPDAQRIHCLPAPASGMMTVPDRISGYSRLLVIVNLTVGVLLLFAILFFLRDIITSVDKKDVKSTYSSHVEAQRQGRKSLQDYDIILRNQPFGSPAGQIQSLAPIVNNTPPPSDLKLIGTIVGSPAYSYAIFATKDGKQEVFKRDESVFGTGVLAKIELYKVFIRQNNQLTEIPMADVFMINMADVFMINDFPSTPDGPGSPQFVRMVGEGSYVIEQRALHQILDNSNRIMTDARLSPHMVGNKQEGFVLNQIKKNGLYDSLGLEAGDVLLGINNYNITNPVNVLQAFTALRGMDRIQLYIIRGGENIAMTYQIR